MADVMDFDRLRAEHPEIEQDLAGLPANLVRQIVLRAGLITHDRQGFLDSVTIDASFARQAFTSGMLEARSVFYRTEIRGAPFDPDLMCVEGANMAEARIVNLIEKAKRP